MNNDLISRQAAINAADIADYTGLVVEDVKSVTDEVVKELKKLPSAQPEQRWIPCSERLPEEGMECWITPKTTKSVYMGMFTRQYGERRDTGFICGNGFMWLNTALAWMPRDPEPEPYECGEQDV